MALVVDDLDVTLSALEERGIVPDSIEVMEAARKAVIKDPDGNVVSLLEIRTAS
jgi:predicted enzyme related to lactoylglutathione lyase